MTPSIATRCDLPNRGQETECKLLTHAIRMSAYSTESALARLIRPHYARGEDEARALMREGIHPVRGPADHPQNLARPPRPRQRPRRNKAIAAPYAELNDTKTQSSGTITYSLKGHRRLHERTHAVRRFGHVCKVFEMRGSKSELAACFQCLHAAAGSPSLRHVALSAGCSHTTVAKVIACGSVSRESVRSVAIALGAPPEQLCEIDRLWADQTNALAASASQGKADDTRGGAQSSETGTSSPEGRAHTTDAEAGARRKSAADSGLRHCVALLVCLASCSAIVLTIVILSGTSMGGQPRRWVLTISDLGEVALSLVACVTLWRRAGTCLQRGSPRSKARYLRLFALGIAAWTIALALWSVRRHTGPWPAGIGVLATTSHLSMGILILAGMWLRLRTLGLASRTLRFCEFALPSGVAGFLLMIGFMAASASSQLDGTSGVLVNSVLVATHGVLVGLCTLSVLSGRAIGGSSILFVGTLALFASSVAYSTYASFGTAPASIGLGFLIFLAAFVLFSVVYEVLPDPYPTRSQVSLGSSVAVITGKAFSTVTILTVLLASDGSTGLAIPLIAASVSLVAMFTSTPASYSPSTGTDLSQPLSPAPVPSPSDGG